MPRPISYAVFCLKKKKKLQTNREQCLLLQKLCRCATAAPDPKVNRQSSLMLIRNGHECCLYPIFVISRVLDLQMVSTQMCNLVIFYNSASFVPVHTTC